MSQNYNYDLTLKKTKSVFGLQTFAKMVAEDKIASIIDNYDQVIILLKVFYTLYLIAKQSTKDIFLDFMVIQLPFYNLIKLMKTLTRAFLSNFNFNILL